MKKLLVLFAFLLITASAGAQVPGVKAKSFIVTELDGSVILEKDSNTTYPIASISKLLVAEQLWKEIVLGDFVTISKSDLVSKSSLVKKNSRFTQEDLLQLSLISSNNQAIYALARVHDEAHIIKEVNDAAKIRGLSSIHLEEPSGLNPNNRASAADLAKFIILIDRTPIANVSIESLAIVSNNDIHSTNPLLDKPGWNFSVSKTGFINASGGCIATIVEIGGKQRAVVILGSDDTHTRWQDLIKIRTFISPTDSFWNGLPLGKKIKPRKHK